MTWRGSILRTAGVVSGYLLAVFGNVWIDLPFAMAGVDMGWASTLIAGALGALLANGIAPNAGWILTGLIAGIGGIEAIMGEVGTDPVYTAVGAAIGSTLWLWGRHRFTLFGRRHPSNPDRKHVEDR